MLRNREPVFDKLTNADKKILGIKPEPRRAPDQPKTPSTKRSHTNRIKSDRPVAEWE